MLAPAGFPEDVSEHPHNRRNDPDLELGRRPSGQHPAVRRIMKEGPTLVGTDGYGLASAVQCAL